MRAKHILISTIIVLSVLISGCGKNNSIDMSRASKEVSNTFVPVTDEPIGSTSSDESGDVQSNMNIVDYSSFFKKIDGCVVIYDVNADTYNIYNESMCNTQVSPYSTFKIVATLMGLKSGVIVDINSKMKYSGKDYSVTAWNKDVTLKEAVQTSCVWYFRQLIDAVGKDSVQSELNALQYGNCDISEWKGSNLNPMEDLNGFWLGSSLLISPMEQINVMKEIFGGTDFYSKSQIKTLKNVLLYDKVNGYKIYGKTGTNVNKEGWYVGVSEKKGKTCYFAVYIIQKNKRRTVSGNDAKNIVKEIFAAE